MRLLPLLLGWVFPSKKRWSIAVPGLCRLQVAASVAILRRVGRSEYVGTEVEARAGRGVWDARWGCSVVFTAACCLGVCLTVAAAVTSTSEIRVTAVVILGKVYVGVVFAVTVL